MKFHPPYGSTDPNAPYVDRDTPGAVKGSAVPARAVEYPQREIVNALVKSGLVPTDDDLFQLLRAMRSQRANYFVDSGVADAVAITMDPVPSSWADLIGVPLRVKIAASNVNAATLSVAGLAGTKPIERADGAATRKGDLPTNAILVLIYDGTAVQVQGMISSLLFGHAIVSYTVPGSYPFVVPDGVYWIKAKVSGGGGAGPHSAATYVGGGGGAAGTAIGWYPVTPGQTITITVGAGGVATTSLGGNGGTSSFGAFCTSTGGQGGQCQGASGCAGGQSGTATGGQTNLVGGWGGDGNPNTQTVQGGHGASSYWGGGSRSSLGSGIAAFAPGSGGGAGWGGSGLGGNGAPGVVVLSY